LWADTIGVNLRFSREEILPRRTFGSTTRAVLRTADTANLRFDGRGNEDDRVTFPLSFPAFLLIREGIRINIKAVEAQFVRFV
jgi:hypothetical protein